jgi:hypothetical protein
MWLSFHPGWLFLAAPLVMLVACMLMCMFGRHGAKRVGMGCCDHTHSVDERR